ncbi:hypothetical protein ACO1M1_14360, partial [Staphylococcus aureus]
AAHGWRHGFFAGRSINRTPGATTARRGIQTESGRGFVTTRQTNYGNGTATNTMTRTYNNGRTATRTGTWTRNSDGSLSHQFTHTGVA